MTVDGELRTAHQFDLDIPTQVASQPVFMRLWLIFKEGVVRPSIEAIQATLARVYQRLGINASPDVAYAAFRSALIRDFGGDVEIRSMVRTQAKDLVLYEQ